jgi:hypothetical protein
MKSTAEKVEKSELCKNDSASACCEPHDKFAIKHITSLVCASYLVTIVIALALLAQVRYVERQQQHDSRINLERLVEVETELFRLKDYSSENNEQLRG